MLSVADGERMTRPQLMEIPIPKYEGSGTKWEGVNHGSLASTVIEVCTAMEFKILSETWYVNPNKAALYGCVDLQPESMGNVLDLGTPGCFSLAIRHSNDQRMAITMGVGAKVFLCSNGVMTAEFLCKKRHLTGLALTEIVEDGINLYVKKSADLSSQIKALRDRPITKQEASYAILKSAREGVIPFRYLEDILENWVHPTHEHFKPRNAWSLYNAFTETAKNKLSPPKQYGFLRELYPHIVSSLDICKN
jgi:hypothetical protein